MTRFNQILAVVLALQIALAAFVLWPSASAQSGGGPLLPNFNSSDVVGLTIQDVLRSPRFC